MLCDSEDPSREAAVALFKELGYDVKPADFIPFMGTGTMWIPAPCSSAPPVALTGALTSQSPALHAHAFLGSIPLTESSAAHETLTEHGVPYPQGRQTSWVESPGCMRSPTLTQLLPRSASLRSTLRRSVKDSSTNCAPPLGWARPRGLQQRFVSLLSSFHGEMHPTVCGRTWRLPFRACRLQYAKPNSGIGFPGALELIREVKVAGLKVAVASSADRIKVDANLAAAGIPLTLYASFHLLRAGPPASGITRSFPLVAPVCVLLLALFPELLAPNSDLELCHAFVAPCSFDAIVSADKFERLKPAPDIFLAASQELGVPQEQVRFWVLVACGCLQPCLCQLEETDSPTDDPGLGHCRRVTWCPRRGSVVAAFRCEYGHAVCGD